MLVMSVLDLGFEPHQRIGRMARAVGVERIGPTTLIYKKGERRRGFGVMCTAMLGISMKTWESEGLRFLELNPLWNIPLGVRTPFIAFLVEWFDTLSFFLAGLRATLFSRRFDVCLVQGPVEGIAGLLLLKLGLVRHLVYDDFDYIPGWYTRRLRSKMVAAAEVFAMKRAHRVTCSGSLLAMLRRIQTGSKIYHIPNGVDLERFRAPTPPRPSPGGKLKLVYAGNISFCYSGLDVVLVGLDLLTARDHIEVDLTIVGHGDPRDVKELERMVGERQSAGLSVRYAGHIAHNEVPRRLWQADVGLALFPPSTLRRFAFPYKVIEYMAAGLAVVGVKSSETARILRQHQCGVSVRFEAAALADALAELAADPARVTAMQRAGWAGAERYDWEELMEREHQLVRESWEAWQS